MFVQEVVLSLLSIALPSLGQISTPEGGKSAVQCESLQISFIDTPSPPYKIYVFASDGLAEGAVEFIGSYPDTANSSFWLVDIPAGANLTFELADNSGNTNYSNPFVVQPSNDSSCIAENIGYIGGPGLPLPPSQRSDASSAFPEASPTTSLSPLLSPQSRASGSLHVAAIAGGVIGGALALLVVVALIVFWRRRHRHHVAHAEPFILDDAESAQDMTFAIATPYTIVSNEAPPPKYTPRAVPSDTAPGTSRATPPSDVSLEAQDNEPNSRPTEDMQQGKRKPASKASFRSGRRT